MKTVIKSFVIALSILLSANMSYADYTTCGSYTTDGDENTNCGMGICCSVWNACNGPNSPCYNYDPDYGPDGTNTGGCDLSCAPIDSGVMFLLIGGAAFGGAILMRRRREALEVIKN